MQWVPQFFVKLRPKWMTHIANLNVLDDDNVFVYGQERYVQEALDQGKNYEQACYMPTNADAWIFGWYRWRAHPGGWTRGVWGWGAACLFSCMSAHDWRRRGGRVAGCGGRCRSGSAR